jgi:hypothetical protein
MDPAVLAFDFGIEARVPVEIYAVHNRCSCLLNGLRGIMLCSGAGNCNTLPMHCCFGDSKMCAKQEDSSFAKLFQEVDKAGTSSGRRRRLGRFLLRQRQK